MQIILVIFLSLIASISFAEKITYSFTPPVPLSQTEQSSQIIELMVSMNQLQDLEEKTVLSRKMVHLSKDEQAIAQSFIDVAEAFCMWVNEDPILYNYGILCASENNVLHSTITMPNLSTSILLTNEEVVDNHGVVKDVVTDMKKRTLTINVPRWQKASLRQRAMTAAMEMSLLIGIPERYLVAQRFIKEKTHPVAKSDDKCDNAIRILTKVMAASSDMISSCYNLVQSGQIDSQNYTDSKRLANHIERLYPFVLDHCKQSCGETNSLCSGAPIPLGSTCRSSY